MISNVWHLLPMLVFQFIFSSKYFNFNWKFLSNYQTYNKVRLSDCQKVPKFDMYLKRINLGRGTNLHPFQQCSYFKVSHELNYLLTHSLHLIKTEPSESEASERKFLLLGTFETSSSCRGEI